MNKAIKQHCRNLLGSICLLALPAIVCAEANAEKIFLSADRMQMDINTGISTYTGNVKVSQGALILTGDKVIVQRGEEDIKRITITGTPAHYNHVTETGESISAESEKMVYIASENRLIMTINAHLRKPDLKLSSHKIIYHTQDQTVIAGEGDSSERVHIILTPKK